MCIRDRALPAAAVINVLLRYADDFYRHSQAYTGGVAPEDAAPTDDVQVSAAQPPSDSCLLYTSRCV